MDVSRINEVMSGKKKETIEGETAQSTGTDSNGVGLINVISRLRLFYGIEDVLDIISEGKDKGTLVRIHIPAATG